MDPIHSPEERTLPEFLINYRRFATRAANIAVVATAYIAAFLIRFDFIIPLAEWRTAVATLPAVILIHYLAFHFFKLTRGWWRYVGIGDFVNVVKASLVAALSLAAYIFFFHRVSSFPRSILLINAILVIGFSIGFRLAVRLWRQVPIERSSGDRKRLLIIGAGDTGEALLREIRQSSRLNYQIVAFLDDDPRKRGTYIDGVPVTDRVGAAPELVQSLKINEIIVAAPSASGKEMRGIIESCRAAGVPFKVMPATWEVLDKRLGLGAAREVEINDLLRRPPVALDLVGIGHFLAGKRVLVSGAAGSIGSEICRQVLRYQPSRLVCLDHDENALFFLERALAKIESRAEVQYRLADITDTIRMDGLFAEGRPQVVYHAAAHKHVPMLEMNPVEGIRNNVFGTMTLATTAGRHGVDAFLLISTDKAVNPTSVMGASKRIAEQLIQTLPYDTRFTAVRFGNVLGSQGSVVPLLKQQIAAGGPVTVTHPEMRRFFMTIPEAVELVIQASAMGKGEEIFILDMGEPVKIVDLANDLIMLSGLRPGVDIEIVFSGVRPGEKLYEELHLGSETADRTRHPKILVARHAEFDDRRFAASLEELRRAVDRNDDIAVRRLIPALVPEFKGESATRSVIPLVASRAS